MSLFQILNTRPIAFNPEYSRICGKETKLNNGKTVFRDDQSCAILLSQLCYWHSAMKGKEFYKTDEELMAECGCFSRDRHLKNKKRLIEMGVISYNVKGTPARGYWQVKEKELISLLTPASSVVVEQPQLDVVEQPQLLYTENTTNIYSLDSFQEELKGELKEEILNKYSKEIIELRTSLKEIETETHNESLKGKKEKGFSHPPDAAAPLQSSYQEILNLYIRWFFTSKKSSSRSKSTFKFNATNPRNGGLLGCLKRGGVEATIDMLYDAINSGWQGIKGDYVTKFIKTKNVSPRVSYTSRLQAPLSPSIPAGLTSTGEIVMRGDISDLY